MLIYLFIELSDVMQSGTILKLSQVQKLTIPSKKKHALCNYAHLTLNIFKNI